MRRKIAPLQSKRSGVFHFDEKSNLLIINLNESLASSQLVLIIKQIMK
jgi:hypothetical protein